MRFQRPSTDMFMSTIEEYRTAIVGDAACAARIAPRMVVPDEIDYTSVLTAVEILSSSHFQTCGARLRSMCRRTALRSP
jgi:hypothetical protein